MFGLSSKEKEREIQMKNFQRDLHDLNAKYWDLYQKHARLLSHLNIAEVKISEHIIMQNRG